jgi:hypothetical protein
MAACSLSNKPQFYRFMHRKDAKSAEAGFVISLDFTRKSGLLFFILPFQQAP